jgi:hypothetical protein
MGYAFVTLHSRWKMEVFASRHFQRDNPKHLASRDDISSKSSKALGVLRPSQAKKKRIHLSGRPAWTNLQLLPFLPGCPSRCCTFVSEAMDVEAAAAHRRATVNASVVGRPEPDAQPCTDAHHRTYDLSDVT